MIHKLWIMIWLIEYAFIFRRYTSSKSKLRSIKANVKRAVESAKTETKSEPSGIGFQSWSPYIFFIFWSIRFIFDPIKARLSAALSVLENEDWKSTKNFDKLKKKLESIVRWKNLVRVLKWCLIVTWWRSEPIRSQTYYFKT